MGWDLCAGLLYEHRFAMLIRDSRASNKRQANLMIDQMEELCLQNLIRSPTRGSNILDLILCNNLEMISQVKITPSVLMSDHATVEFSINHTYKVPKMVKKGEKPYLMATYKHEIEGGREEDWMRYQYLMSRKEERWNLMAPRLTLAEKVKTFYSMVEETVTQVFPLKAEYSGEGKRKTKNKIPRQARTLMRQRRKIAARLKMSKSWQNSLTMMKKLEETEKSLKNHYTERKKKLEKVAISKLRRDPKYFYAYANKFSKDRGRVGALVDKEGKVCSSIKEQCEVLRAQFQDFFSEPDKRYDIPDVGEFCELPPDEPPATLFPPMVGVLPHPHPLLRSPEQQRGPGHPGQAPPMMGALPHPHPLPLRSPEQQRDPGHPDQAQHRLQQDLGPRGQAQHGLPERGGLQPQLVHHAAAPASLGYVIFTGEDVKEAINLMPSTSAPGSDGMVPKLMKRAKGSISRILADIFQHSLETGEIPALWKEGYIVPVHKGGPSSMPENYRPVCLTSHVIKSQERVIRRSLVNFLEAQNRMDERQHGARGGRSTLSQLLEHHYEIIKIMERGENADVIYSDFSKAFQKVDHGLLLHKIRALGIKGKLLRWISNFLRQRKQRVLIDGEVSEETEVASSVPEGTVVGPLFFLIYVSDIGTHVDLGNSIGFDNGTGCGNGFVAGIDLGNGTGTARGSGIGRDTSDSSPGATTSSSTSSSSSSSSFPLGSSSNSATSSSSLGNSSNSTTSIKIYIDDAKASKAVRGEEDVEELQRDLDSLFNWASDNNMVFNAKKFQVVRYGKNEELKEATMYFTEDTSEIVQRQETVRDLGVILSEDGGFKHHLEKVVTKTRQKMGWVLRTFESRSPQLMKTLLKTLILPHIDYCSQLYCPTRPADIQKLEKVQKDFLKRIPALRQKTYWQQLETFQLYSIQRRLERYRIIYVWKVLEHYVPNPGLVETHTQETRLGRRCAAAEGRGREARAAFDQTFQFHGPRLYNALPRDLRNLTGCGAEIFKEELDQYLAGIADEPAFPGFTPTGISETGAPSNSLIYQAAGRKEERRNETRRRAPGS